MTVAGNDLASFKSGPEVVRDSLVTEIATDLFLHLLQPIKNFLVGSAMAVSVLAFPGEMKKGEHTSRVADRLGR